MQYAAENGNGAEGWSMQVLNGITSRFEEMQLIYVIKTWYTVVTPTVVVNWHANLLCVPVSIILLNKDSVHLQ